MTLSMISNWGWVQKDTQEELMRSRIRQVAQTFMWARCLPTYLFIRYFMEPLTIPNPLTLCILSTLDKGVKKKWFSSFNCTSVHFFPFSTIPTISHWSYSLSALRSTLNSIVYGMWDSFSSLGLRGLNAISQCEHLCWDSVNNGNAYSVLLTRSHVSVIVNTASSNVSKI